MRQKAAEELRTESFARGFSHAFEIVSGSMRPLFRTGDTILVSRVAACDVRTGDIIVWKSSRYAAPQVAHRVLSRRKVDGGWQYRTKGDYNLWRDDEPVDAASLIGKVVAVRRGAFTVRLDAPAGRIAGIMLSAAMYIWLLASAGFDRVCRSLRLLMPEGPYIADNDTLLLRYATGSIPEDWRYSVNKTLEYLGSVGHLNEIKMADVHVGGGFSEEAFVLHRKGIAVDSIDIRAVTGTSGVYDCVMAVRMIDYLASRQARSDLLKGIYSRLCPGGSAVVSCIRQFRKGSIRSRYSALRRHCWSFFLGRRYHGPRDGEVIVRGRYIKQDSNIASLTAEIRAAGFKIDNLDDNGRVLTLLLKK